jgi:hypothetical protein
MPTQPVVENCQWRTRSARAIIFSQTFRACISAGGAYCFRTHVVRGEDFWVAASGKVNWKLYVEHKN